MKSMQPVAAIYVPLELERDVEQWIKKKYNVEPFGSTPPRGQDTTSRALLGASPIRAKRNPSPVSNTHTNSLRVSTPNKRPTTGNPGGGVWARLATPPKRKEAQVETPRSKSAQRDRSAEGLKVFEKLYMSGISQNERHQKAVDQAKARKIAEEDAEIRRGKILMKVLSCSDNYGLRGAAFEQKMDEAARASRLSETEVKNVVTRLSKSRPSATTPHRRTEEEKEMTFHPKISEPSTASKEEINERFNCLYKDAKRQERTRTELRHKYEDKERKLLLDRRIRDDEVFRCRVNQDPAIGKKFLDSL